MGLGRVGLATESYAVARKPEAGSRSRCFSLAPSLALAHGYALRLVRFYNFGKQKWNGHLIFF